MDEPIHRPQQQQYLHDNNTSLASSQNHTQSTPHNIAHSNHRYQHNQSGSHGYTDARGDVSTASSAQQQGMRSGATAAAGSSHNTSMDRDGDRYAGSVSTLTDKGQQNLTLESGYHSNRQASVGTEDESMSELATTTTAAPQDDYGDYGFGYVSRGHGRRGLNTMASPSPDANAAGTGNNSQTNRTPHNATGVSPPPNVAVSRSQSTGHVKSKMEAFQANIPQGGAPDVGVGNDGFSPTSGGSNNSLSATARNGTHFAHRNQQPSAQPAAHLERHMLAAHQRAVTSSLHPQPDTSHRDSTDSATHARNQMRSPAGFDHPHSPPLPPPPQPKPRISLDSSHSSHSLRSHGGIAGGAGLKPQAKPRVSLDSHHSTSQTHSSSNNTRQSLESSNTGVSGGSSDVHHGRHSIQNSTHNAPVQSTSSPVHRKYSNEMMAADALSYGRSTTDGRHHRDSTGSNPATMKSRSSTESAYDVSAGGGGAQSAPSLRHRSATPDSVLMSSWDKSFSPQHSLDETAMPPR